MNVTGLAAPFRSRPRCGDVSHIGSGYRNGCVIASGMSTCRAKSSAWTHSDAYLDVAHEVQTWIAENG